MNNTLSKAIMMLELLSENPNISSAEISEKMNIPRSSTHLILKTLHHYQLVKRDNLTKKFTLGIKLIELGNLAQLELDLCRIASPYLKGLNELTNETIHLGIISKDAVMYVDCIESQQRLRTHSVIGVQAPLHCTGVGKAMMAFLPEQEIDRIINKKGLQKKTAQTITTRELMLKELASIRHRGYSIDNMEHEENIVCVATPVRNSNGEAFASISISGPAFRLPEERLNGELAETIKNTAKEISAKMGYRG
ncbi:IclR family transcriptional regulator [Halalkalibacter lacteus]|uniref:IclR family transcriptional regulator n=1 Tax=Halalkalibacter lacteus TaxID=3090663 RepID=UPI002FC5FCD2